MKIYNGKMMKKLVTGLLLASVFILVQSVIAAELLPGDFRKLDPESCIPDERVTKGNKAKVLITQCDDGQAAITLQNNGKMHDWLQIKYTLSLKPYWKKLISGNFAVMKEKYTSVGGKTKYKVSQIHARKLKDAVEKINSKLRGCTILQNRQQSELLDTYICSCDSTGAGVNTVRISEVQESGVTVSFYQH